MASKALLLVLGLFAVVLLIASEVSASDLASHEPKKVSGAEKETDSKMETEQYGGRYGGGGYPGGGYPGGGGGYPGGGYPGGGGGYPGGGYPGGGYPGGGYRRGYCRYGCCYRGYRGCARCCSYAGEVAEAQVETKPHN